MILAVSFLWFVVFAKKLSFWIWLWQLKEYHVGRFVDHFRTHKGRKLLLSPLWLLKIALAAALYFHSEIILVYVIAGLFFIEFLFAIKSFAGKSLRIPVLTRKTSVVLSAGVSLEFLIISFLYGAGISLVRVTAVLLVFDILVPLVASLLVMAFQPLAVALRDQTLKKAKRMIKGAEGLLVIGITGSYGKTSAKEFLSVILSKKYRVLKTAEHQNSEIGISNCVINGLNNEHEIFIVEMGAYNKGGIKVLTDIVSPKIGILTGINEQHMATFGSLQKTIQAKFELIESLPEDGLAILNRDDQNIKKQKVEDYNHKIKNVKFYSMADKSADIWAEEVKAETRSLSFKIKSKDGDQADFQLNLPGAHNIYNILAAAACAKYLGMSLPEISMACADIDPQQSGVQPREGINGLNLLDATYSANPTGVISHLDYLKLWPGKKIIIMPCLIELGGASKDVHRKIGEKIAEVCDLAVITTKDRVSEIKEGGSRVPVSGQGEKQPEIVFMENSEAILEKVKEFADPEDVVLLESRVPAKVISGLSKKS
jgi:UDP-N-acetylmuramoyl-tripeptide--D-alanyl-D-alanine ligase